MSRIQTLVIPPFNAIKQMNVALALAMFCAFGFVTLESSLENWLGVESPLISLLGEPPWLYVERAALLWLLPAAMLYWLIGRFVPAQRMRSWPWVVHAPFLIANMAVAVYMVLLTTSVNGQRVSFALLRSVEGVGMMALAAGCLCLVCRTLLTARRFDSP